MAYGLRKHVLTSIQSSRKDIFMLNHTTAQIAIGIITENIRMLNEGNEEGVVDLLHITHIRIYETDILVYN